MMDIDEGKSYCITFCIMVVVRGHIYLLGCPNRYQDICVHVSVTACIYFHSKCSWLHPLVSKLPILVSNRIHMTPLRIQVQPIETYI